MTVTDVDTLAALPFEIRKQNQRLVIGRVASWSLAARLAQIIYRGQLRTDPQRGPLLIHDVRDGTRWISDGRGTRLYDTGDEKSIATQNL